MTDPDRLIDRYLDGKLTPEEWQQLERDLKHPRYADRFAEAMLVDSLMHERYERDEITSSLRRDDGSFMGEQDLALLMADYDNAKAELVDISRLAEDAERGGGARNPRREPVDPMSPREVVSIIGYLAMCGLVRGLKTPAGMAVGAAAAVLLGVALFFALSGHPQAPTTPTPTASQTPTPRAPAIATLTNTHNAVWAGPASAALARGSELHPNDRLTLTAGFAEITTKRGAVAILEAPATIELTDHDNAIELLSGKLVGICETDSSKGFVVATPHMEVTDLGTRFGIAVDASDNTLAQVFAGQVAVRNANVSRAGSEPRILNRNESVAIDAAGNEAAPPRPADETFARLQASELTPPANLAHGVRALSGALRWSDQTPQHVNRNQMPGHPDALIRAELWDHRLQEPIAVGIHQAGTEDTFNFENRTPATIAPGTVIRSYVVTFKSDDPERAMAITGQATFQGEVLGVIAFEPQWDQFKQVTQAAVPIFIFTPGDLVPALRSNDLPAGDAVTISADRKTVGFTLSNRSSWGDHHTEYLRIIVQSPAGVAP